MGNLGEGQSPGSNPIIQKRPQGPAGLASLPRAEGMGSWLCVDFSHQRAPSVPGPFLLLSPGEERMCASPKPFRLRWVGLASKPTLLLACRGLHPGRQGCPPPGGGRLNTFPFPGIWGQNRQQVKQGFVRQGQGPWRGAFWSRGPPQSASHYKGNRSSSARRNPREGPAGSCGLSLGPAAPDPQDLPAHPCAR